MKIIIIIAELVVFALLSFLGKKIRTFQFYTAALRAIKCPIFCWASMIEGISYWVTNTVTHIPSFSIAPHDFEYWSLDGDDKNTATIVEKIIINLMRFILYLRSLFGNVLYDIILVITLLTFRNVIHWKAIWQCIVNTFGMLATPKLGEIILYALKWGLNNINAALVLLIIVISAYAAFLKLQKRKYTLEAVWAEDDQTRIKEVARIQAELEDDLLQLRASVFFNLRLIQKMIRFHKDGKPIQNNHLEDYHETTDRIKKHLREISEQKGITIYSKRNAPIYTQLALLDLLPSLSNGSETFTVLEYANKPYVNKRTETQELLESYAYGISIINGIGRFLRFSYKKRDRYTKISFRISDTDYVNNVIEKINS